MTTWTGLDATVPFIAMTYYNIVLHYGLDRCAGKFAASGISGAIIPDLALEETGPVDRRLRRGGRGDRAAGRPVDATRTRRRPRAPRRRVSPTRRPGWPSRANPKGEGTASASCASIRRTSDVPALIGIGIASAEQAREAARVSDGVIVGSALVQVILDGGGATDVERFIREFRSAMDD